MNKVTVKGDIQAGRDNVFNIGDQATYKSIYQMDPDALRIEDRHSRKVCRNYRFDRIRKSKIFFLFLLVGIFALIISSLFIRDLYIDFTGGATPNIKLVAHFIMNELSSTQDHNDFLILLFSAATVLMLFLILPVFAIKNLWLDDDEFLQEERIRRNEIRKRLLSLGEKP